MGVSPRSFVVVAFVLAMLAGCASSGYSKVESGVVTVGKMRVTLGSGWQRAPGSEVPEKKAVAKVYSRDSLETEPMNSPSQMCLQNLPDIHPARHAQGVQYQVDRSAVG